MFANRNVNRFANPIKWKHCGYFLFLVIFTLVAAEILLRIYNPFPTSVTGDRITLHSNTRRILENIKGPELDSRVIILKNSLAFRGPEPPANFQDHLTLFTIGGSTTECIVINEEKTWPALLSKELNKSFNNVWTNNAGLNGHSTYGHIKLLEDYIIPLHPKVCVFLVGCNDVDRPDLSKSDKTVYNENQNFLITLARFSRLVNVLLNFYRHHRAKQREMVQGMPYTLRGFPPKFINDSIANETISGLRPDVVRYRTRVKRIIELCRTARILPIFVTQPCVLGQGIDDITGVDLALFPYRNVNGSLFWKKLNVYNEETKRICSEEEIMVIDLANQLTKSSKYFYDIFHFNNAGSARVAEIIGVQLIPHLQEKFPHFRSGR